VGLIQRELETAGLNTVSITLMQELTAKIRVPRAVYVNFPLGRVTGKAFDVETQTRVVTLALQAMQDIGSPGGIVKLPIEWKTNKG
jgi:D-proline reductase (dithiol) PrdB